MKTSDKEIMIKASRARGKGHIIHRGSKIRICFAISFKKNTSPRDKEMTSLKRVDLKKENKARLYSGSLIKSQYN